MVLVVEALRANPLGCDGYKEVEEREFETH